jgi:GMP synthase (glutamine-hydrolysing)
MTKPLSMLVLKMGSTLPALKSRKGDFEDWIIAGLGLAPDEAVVIDVPSGEPLPRAERHGGIVITGSHTMVTERKPWSERAAEWLREAVSREVPILGICYGHQLLAHAYGGTVANNPLGREFGTVEVAMAEEAGKDALLGILPRRLSAHVGHTQSVIRLPERAVRLASNAWDGNQAFRMARVAWGVQFHPEFDADIMREYITSYHAALAAEGQDTERLLGTIADTPQATQLLRRFTQLCREEAK